MLEVLLLLAAARADRVSRSARSPSNRGNSCVPFEPMGEYLKSRGIDWTYHRDNPSFRLLDEQPDHGCDLCSRYRRRAVYQIVRGLGANVIAFGHTADDFCESFLRNALFTGRISALPPITWSRERDFRLIRPLVYVTEDLTTRFAESLGAPVIPCGCSQRTGTVRRSLRDMSGRAGKGISASEGNAAFGDGEHRDRPPAGSAVSRSRRERLETRGRDRSAGGHLPIVRIVSCQPLSSPLSCRRWPPTTRWRTACAHWNLKRSTGLKWWSSITAALVARRLRAVRARVIRERSQRGFRRGGQSGVSRVRCPVSRDAERRRRGAIPAGWKRWSRPRKRIRARACSRPKCAGRDRIRSIRREC